MRTLAACCLFLAAGQSSYAQRWMHAKSSASQPIDVAKDTIAVTLKNARVAAEKNWLKKVDRAGLVVHAAVTGRSLADGSIDIIKFPFAYDATVRSREDNSANMPFGKNLIPRLKLRDENTEHEALHIGVTLVRTDKARKLAKVLKMLLQVSGEAALPATPFGTAVGYVVRFASAAVDDALGSTGKKEKLELGQAPLVFGTDSEIVHTGRYALVEKPTKDNWDKKKESWKPGFFDPNNDADRCLTVEDKWDAVIQLGKKVSDKCTGPYAPLKNRFVAFLIQKKATTDAQREAARAECRQNGFEAADCPALN